MPTYDYKCEKCGYTFEEDLKIADRKIPTEERCRFPTCGGEVAQVVAAAPVAKTTVSGVSKVRGSGSGITGTIMTDATGIEEEANVAKTALGGTTKKKKKYA